ncbi:MAG: hypothetical protein II891_02740 [Bacteroidales bacterium]|nr:hypothetical protein [Bacteroidales bacterium]
MKKILSFISVAVLLGAALAVSCKKIATDSKPVEESADGETATLNITLSGVDMDISTRASGTGEYNGDKTAASVQILIFDSAGNYVKKATAVGTVKLSKGMYYTIIAVVNGPEVSNLNLIQTRAVVASLADNPFVMHGQAIANLSEASTGNITVPVSSLASRVHLTSVKNSLPTAFGAITLKRVYLCNVKGQVQLDATAVDSWYNQYGRKALGTLITAGSTTGAVDAGNTGSAYTFKSYETSPATSIAAGTTYSANAYYYTFPNPLKTAIPANIATTTTWNEQATWLTICGQVGDKIYYWTANLGVALTNGLERNNSYDVSITLNNLGSTDPGTPVTEASVTLGINVQPWQAGSEITQTL